MKKKATIKFCQFCGKKFVTEYPWCKIFCSDKCSSKNRRMERRIEKEKKLKKINEAKLICPICKNEFIPSHHKTKYCSETCGYIAKKSYQVNIKNIRDLYKKLLENNPIKAQRIADEMEEIEGKKFRNLVLDGLAPFKNPKQNKNRRYRWKK